MNFPGFKVLKSLHKQNEGGMNLASQIPSARPLLSSSNHGIVVCYQEPTLYSGVCAFKFSLNAGGCIAGLISVFPHLCFLSLPCSRGDTNIRCVLHSKMSFSAARLPRWGCAAFLLASLAVGMMIRVMRTLHGLSLLPPDLLSTTQRELCLCKDQT